MKYFSAGEGKVEVEFRYLVSAQIFNAALAQIVECDWRIQVVKNPLRTIQRKHIIIDALAFRQITCRDHRVRSHSILQRHVANAIPTRIDDQLAVIACGEIAVLGVIRVLALKEGDGMPLRMQRADQRTVRGSVSVAP